MYGREKKGCLQGIRSSPNLQVQVFCSHKSTVLPAFPAQG